MMELTQIGSIAATGAKLLKQGSDTFEATAGQRLTIETSPSGTEVLDVTVPSGKAWTIEVRVTVQETDA